MGQTVIRALLVAGAFTFITLMVSLVVSVGSSYMDPPLEDHELDSLPFAEAMALLDSRTVTRSGFDTLVEMIQTGTLLDYLLISWRQTLVLFTGVFGAILTFSAWTGASNSRTPGLHAPGVKPRN